MRPVVAERLVPRPAEELYEQLADLRTHWSLAGRWVHPLELRADGGTVQVRGPLGLHRTASTELTTLDAPHRVAGTAASGATRAAISWELVPDDGGTRVTLRADLLETGPLDRALLALGGRWWMTRRFAATLQRLG